MGDRIAAMKRLGKQKPLYNFFLNPYKDARFTRCPKCGARTRQRKLPLVIHVDPLNPVSVNFTCRYCPGCDLLIAHKDRLEQVLTAMLQEHNPELVGHEYLVIGTLDRPVWQKGVQSQLTIRELLDNLHDFKQVLLFKPAHYGWG